MSEPNANPYWKYHDRSCGSSCSPNCPACAWESRDDEVTTLKAQFAAAQETISELRLPMGWPNIWWHDKIRALRNRNWNLSNQLAAAQLEGERLTSCLLKANTSSEKFERDWYLTLDQLAAALADVARKDAALQAADRYIHYHDGSVTIIREILGPAVAQLREYRECRIATLKAAEGGK